MRLARFALPLLLACGTAKTDDAPTDTDTDTTDDATTEDASTDEGADVDSDSTDIEIAEPLPGLQASDLVGTFLGSNPTEACFATILDNTVVELTSPAPGEIVIWDGGREISCTLADGALTCPQVSATTTSIPIAPGVYCDWPYSVDVTIGNLSADGFDATVQFATSPSPTSQACAAALSQCSGAATATFARWIAPTPDAPMPAAKHMVKATN